MFCHNCGQLAAATDNYCIHCGTRLTDVAKCNETIQMASNETDETSQPEDSSEEWALFIGPNNTDKYLGVWASSDSPETKVRWHWPAFFITPFWLAYRKMYLWLFVYALLSVIRLVFAPKIVGDFVGLGFSLSASLLAYPLYYRHLISQMNKAKEMTALSPNQYQKELKRRGGTSGTALAVTIIAYAIVSITIGSVTAYKTISKAISQNPTLQSTLYLKWTPDIFVNL